MYRATISAVLIVLLASTAAFAAPLIPENLVPIQDARAPEAAGGAEHDCCHPMAHFRQELVPPNDSSEMPCGGRHSCCMSSAPEYPANVPSTRSWERQGTGHDSVGDETALPSCNFCTLRGTPGVLPPLYSRFSTVLQI